MLILLIFSPNHDIRYELQLMLETCRLIIIGFTLASDRFNLDITQKVTEIIQKKRTIPFIGWDVTGCQEFESINY